MRITNKIADEILNYTNPVIVLLKNLENTFNYNSFGQTSNKFIAIPKLEFRQSYTYLPDNRNLVIGLEPIEFHYRITLQDVTIIARRVHIKTRDNIEQYKESKLKLDQDFLSFVLHTLIGVKSQDLKDFYDLQEYKKRYGYLK